VGARVATSSRDSHHWAAVIVKRVLVGATLLWVGLARPAVAQEHEVRVWGAIGTASPREGDGVTNAVGLGNLYDSAGSRVAGVSYGIRRQFAVLAEFEWNRRMPFREDNAFFFSHPSENGHLVAGEPLRISGGAIGLTFALRHLRIVAPYAVAAVGVSHVDWAVTEHDESSVPRSVDPTGVRQRTYRIASSHTRPALAAGLGIELSPTRWAGLIGEWRYHRAFAPESAAFTEGLFVKRTSYSTIRAGLYVRVH